jgi:hypothetical protein
LIDLEAFRSMARVVADPSADLGVVWNTFPRLPAALAVFVLLVATVLAVCKLRGQTSPQQTLLVNLETRRNARKSSLAYTV